MMTKLSASGDTSTHMQRARAALESAQREGLNCGGLEKPSSPDRAPKGGREEIDKALAIIARMRW
jgi:hypothetical protein